MNRFDQITVVNRIRNLLLERNVNRTEAQVQWYVRNYMRLYDISLERAFEEYEQTLLDNNPRPERWDETRGTE